MSNPTQEDIENLIELFKRSDWQEMHLKTDTLDVFLSNDSSALAPAAQSAQASASAVPVATLASGGPAPAADAPAPAPAAATIPDGMVAVHAPNLGTFYRAPKPGAPPYVEVGQTVSAGSEVCLIEVMKLFTPVKAGVDGVVREVRVSDGDMVEYQQVLVIIEPTA